MDRIKIAKIFIGFLLTTISLLGLGVNVYSFRSKTFQRSNLLLLWNVVIIAVFTVVYSNKVYENYNKNELGLGSVIDLYYNMNIIGAIINYVWQLVMSRKGLEFLKMVKLFDVMRYLDLNMTTLRSTILKVLIKTTLFPLLIEISLLVRQKRKHPNWSPVWTLYTLYPMFIANIIPNCFFGGMVACKELVSALNVKLNDIKKKANFYQSTDQVILHKKFHRMQTFCDLADKLDELSEKYTWICSQILLFKNISELPILASLVCNLFGITVGLFQQYYTIADTLINEESYDLHTMVTSCIFVLISFCEIAFHSYVANDCLEHV